jgi:hypothetical protein
MFLSKAIISIYVIFNSVENNFSKIFEKNVNKDIGL